MTLPAALRTSAAHVFVDDLSAPELDERDRHHLARVLRLRDGEAVTLSDGAGRWCPARWRAGGAEVTGEPVAEEAGPTLTIAAAIPKGDRLEWMVQKLVEVGVSVICLTDFARSVVRWDAARAAAQVTRLERIARDAAMQSRRVWLPRLTGPVPVAAVLADHHGSEVLVADPDGEALQPAVAARIVVIGPEGGFQPQETEGARCVSLGRHVLRVETAAVVAAVRSTTPGDNP